jgi:Family of unknown function (DUF6069)
MGFQRLISPAERRRARLLGIVAAVLVAAAVWVLAELAFGSRLQAPAGTAAPEPVDIGPLNVALASVLLSLVGWAVLAGLERLTRRARRLWLVVALVGLAASLSTPLSGTGVSTANRMVLVLMHLAVGAVVISVLYRTSPGRRAHASQVPSAVAHGEAA